MALQTLGMSSWYTSSPPAAYWTYQSVMVAIVVSSHELWAEVRAASHQSRVMARESICAPLFDVYVCAPPPVGDTPVGSCTFAWSMVTAVAHWLAPPLMT